MLMAEEEGAFGEDVGFGIGMDSGCPEIGHGMEWQAKEKYEVP
jgi:hypothetical protein